jgi:uncharacterized hydrophobic protein (TIGR00341 family)
MSSHIISVILPKDEVDQAISVAKRDGVTFAGISAAKGKTRTVSFLSAPDCQQSLLDDLQESLSKVDDWKITISPVDAVITKKKENGSAKESIQSREELLEQISRGAQLTSTYFILVAVSAIVSALGMTGDNVAVIIGAMVIAPLLGPVLASILGVSLGERELIYKSALASVSGMGLAVMVGLALGVLMPFDTQTSELAARGQASFADIALAFAAGIAAALSISAGVSSVLVGVMVAVALMPPATAIGLFLGKGEMFMASGAATLLAVNLCALYLSGQAVFYLRGIRPRTWYMRKKAEQSLMTSLLAWSVLLLALCALIWFRFTN